MKPSAVPKTLRPFVSQGLELTGKVGSQRYGDCPVCGKANKFYVNESNGLWDCKYCEESGNLFGFLEFIHNFYVECFNENMEAQEDLARNRGLPLSAFQKQGIGWDDLDQTYVFAGRGLDGRIRDLRKWSLRYPMMRSTSGCKVQLMGMDELLNPKKKSEVVYLCEGEWDMVALRWLLRLLKLPGVVVSVPGAGIFKEEWRNAFTGREVFCCFDNDDPGARGDTKAHSKLNGFAKRIHHLDWPGSCPGGWDVRDWIVDGAIRRGVPRKCFKVFKSLFVDRPREYAPDIEMESDREDYDPPEKRALSEVLSAFNKWLVLPSVVPIEVSLATMVSNQLKGDPLWMFLVAPPGSAKTETLRAYEGAPGIIYREGLTPHSLISGIPIKRGYDPSLLSQLDGKILVVKDFTPILSMRDTEREEIFGTLRSAYDGSVSKQFGTGEKHYRAVFTILAAVTPKIYEVSAQHAALGERFLNYVMLDELTEQQEREICDRVLEDAGHEVEMRQELNLTMRGFYENFEALENEPKLTPEIKSRLNSLGRFLAYSRGTVTRDSQRPELVVARPSRETPTRCAKQLKKLAVGLAAVRGKKQITMSEYEVVRKCAVDSTSQRRIDILEAIWRETHADERDTMSLVKISQETTYPVPTVARVTADLTIIGILRRVSRGEYCFTDSARAIVRDSLVFESKLVQTRPRLRIRREPPRPPA